MSSLVLGNPVDNKQKWLALAPFVRKHFDTGNKTDKDIAFDLAYANYKIEKKKDERWKRFSEEIG